jgi:MFS family permease
VGSWRDFVGGSVLWVGLSAVFDGTHLIVLPALVAATVDPAVQGTALGLLSFGALALAALAQPYFGSLSDRARARTTRLPFVAPAVLGAIVGLGLLALATSFGVVVAAVVITYLCASAVQAAQQGLLPEVFRRQRRGLASGAKQVADLVGAALAFAVLAAVLPQGTGPALAAVALIVASSYLLARTLLRESGGPTVAPAAPAAEVVESRAHFRRLVATRFVFLLATYAIGRFLVFLVATRLGVEPSAAAATAAGLIAALTLTTGVSALGWGIAADHIGRPRVSATGALLSAFGTLGLLVASDLSALGASGLLLAAGSGAFASANWAATADAVPLRAAGRWLGLASMATWAAAACAGLLGPLVDLGNAVVAGGGYVALLSVSCLLFLACVPLALMPERSRTTDGLLTVAR